MEKNSKIYITGHRVLVTSDQNTNRKGRKEIMLEYSVIPTCNEESVR